MCYKVFLLLTAGSLCERWCFLTTAFEELVLPCGGGDCFLSVFSQTSCQDISLCWLSGAFWIPTQGRWDGRGATGAGANPLSAGKGSLRCSAWARRGKPMNRGQMRVAYCGHQGWNGGRWMARWVGRIWGAGGALWSQSNPRLRSLLPEPPRTLFPVAWSTPQRSWPGTDWGAASLLHCGWSDPRLGRSETQRRWETSVHLLTQVWYIAFLVELLNLFTRLPQNHFS